MVYPPAEDTYLTVELLDGINSEGLCVEIGSGSCIVASHMAAKCRHVVAVDVDLEACRACPPNIDVVCSDAAEAVVRSDVAVSNPPYLPPDTPIDVRHHDVDALPKILRWVSSRRPRTVILTFSSLGRLELVLETLRAFCRIVEIDAHHLFFETMYSVKAVCH